MGFHASDRDPPGRKLDATNQAAVDIMKILRALATPRHAAAAIAVVRANLHRDAGAKTAADVCRMTSDDDKAALEIWEAINA